MSDRHRTWEKLFLSTLEKTGNISGAARAAKIGRQTAYDHMKADPDFADRCQEALDTAEDTLEAELTRRALEGEQVPVYFKGKVVGHNTRKSDALLMFAIKNLRQRRQRDVPKASSLRQFLGLKSTSRPLTPAVKPTPPETPKEDCPMPRQPRFTNDQVAEALRSAAGIRNAAASLLDCSPSTIKRYVDRCETLARIEKEVVEFNLDLAESGLLDAINDGNLTAIMFYLKTKGKHRGYSERYQVEGKDGGPLEVKAKLDFSDLSPAGVQFLQTVVQRLMQQDSAGRPAESSGAPVVQVEADDAAPSGPTQPQAEGQRI